MSSPRMRTLIGTLALLACIPMTMLLLKSVEVLRHEASSGAVVIVWLLGAAAFTAWQWKLSKILVSLFRRD